MSKSKIELCAMNCHYRFFELEEFFKSVNSIGFKKVEIWTSPHHFFMDYQGFENPDKLSNLAKKYNIKIDCICPEQTNPKPNNIASKDPSAKERTLNYFKNAVKVAENVGANKVLITGGWSFLNESVEEAWDRSVSMLKKVSSFAQKKGIIIAIESLQKEESLLVNNISSLKRMLDDVNSDNLKVCVDLGAMAGAGETIEDYFRCFGDKIVHCHFVDGKPVGHLAWGDGSRSMKQDILDFKRNGYEGCLSIESVNSKYYSDPHDADKKTFEMFSQVKEEIL